MSRLDQPSVSRRSFLSLSAIGSFFAALAVAAAGALRLPNPTVLPGPVRRYKIGPPERFPVGSQIPMAAENFVVFRDTRGLYAISTTCTHLGCTVGVTAQGFACPCHGSKFDPSGKVVGGPAPRALPWLELSVAADGQLVVHADSEVPPGTRLGI
ncbi:MAG: ubiquinol-cytochrome c reductase iron-sulfur subunit [Acidobacteriia bacterium]|nr:ubiquinol-cytochrome c reductase iron-sulfur subunit [Terriglobia bacterium]